jgi:hypothetical protein
MVKLLSGMEGKDLYNQETTHMICPTDTKTLKTLAAILSGSWIINDPEWLFKSVEAKKLVDEETFGYRYVDNIFKGKSMKKSEKWLELCSDKKKQSSQWPGFLELLWERCSGGVFVEEEDADYIMAVEGEEFKGDGKVVTWHQFMSLIPTSKQ